MSVENVYRESARDVPVLGDFDVIACGGGPAGCSAALCAARHGAKTLLIEKDGYLGGATVSQLVCVILSTNGVDFQGVWHEFARVMQQKGAVHGLAGGPGQFRGSFDPEVVKHVWDEMLDKDGIQFLHHAWVAGVIVEDGSAKGVLVETNAGRRAIFAKRVIDCTGDGTVCAQAGVEWAQGDGKNPWAMACTKLFRMGNVNRQQRYTPEQRTAVQKSLDEALSRGEYDSPVVANGRAYSYAMAEFTYDFLPLYRREHLNPASRVLRVNPLDPFDLTRAEREGRAQAWQCAGFVRKNVPGYEDAYLLDTSNHIGVRSSRRIQGLAVVTEDDALNLRKYPDGIARSSWSIDVWPAESYDAAADAHPDPDWKARIRAGDYFDIRYGCIVAKGIDNLLMAGRCISSEHLAQSSLRIQQTCMATGQAAGTTAALSLKLGVTPRELDPMIAVVQLEKDRAAVEPAFDCLKNLSGKRS